MRKCAANYSEVTMEQNDAGIKATGKLGTGNYTSDS